MGLSPKRYWIVTSIIGVFFTTALWHLSDVEAIPTDSFYNKLIMAMVFWVALQITSYLLLGRKEVTT